MKLISAVEPFVICSWALSILSQSFPLSFFSSISTSLYPNVSLIVTVSVDLSVRLTLPKSIDEGDTSSIA